MKKGFTIVELLMVVGIIGVLLGIVTTAASGAVKNSRSRRADVMCKLVEAGLNTYHAQYGKWPVTPPEPNDGNADTASDGTKDPNRVVLTATEVKNWIYKLVELTKNGKPVMDVSGLFVSKYEGRSGQKCYGKDFMLAIKGDRKDDPYRMKIGEMNYGYQDVSTGYFRHFKIVYSHASDSVTVSRQ